MLVLPLIKHFTRDRDIKEGLFLREGLCKSLTDSSFYAPVDGELAKMFDVLPVLHILRGGW
jgi:hypothetical protein